MMKGKWIKVKEYRLELNESNEYRSEIIKLELGLERIFLRIAGIMYVTHLAENLQVEAHCLSQNITLHFDEDIHVHLGKKDAKKLRDLMQDGIKIITQWGIDSEMIDRSVKS